MSMDQAVADLQTRLQLMEQELLQQRAANGALQAIVAAAQTAAAQPAAQPRSVIDTRGLGRPETFDGSVSKWRDWKVVMQSCTAACHDNLGQLMDVAENTEDPVMNAALTVLGSNRPANSWRS